MSTTRSAYTHGPSEVVMTDSNGLPELSVPRIVPPSRRMPVTSRGARMRERSNSSSPSKLSSRPTHPIPLFQAALTTARMTAFNPGASPPPVRMPSRLMGLIRSDYNKQGRGFALLVGNSACYTSCFIRFRHRLRLVSPKLDGGGLVAPELSKGGTVGG